MGSCRTERPTRSQMRRRVWRRRQYRHRLRAAFTQAHSRRRCGRRSLHYLRLLQHRRRQRAGQASLHFLLSRPRRRAAAPRGSRPTCRVQWWCLAVSINRWDSKREHHPSPPPPPPPPPLSPPPAWARLERRRQAAGSLGSRPSPTTSLWPLASGADSPTSSSRPRTTSRTCSGISCRRCLSPSW